MQPTKESALPLPSTLSTPPTASRRGWRTPNGGKAKGHGVEHGTNNDVGFNGNKYSQEKIHESKKRKEGERGRERLGRGHNIQSAAAKLTR